MKEISKAERILALYDELMAGRSVHREEWAAAHGICERSVRRDLDAIQQHLGERNDRSRQKTYILYDRKSGCHHAAHLESCELTAEEFEAAAAALAAGGMEEETRLSLLRKLFFSALTEETRQQLPAWGTRFLNE